MLRGAIFDMDGVLVDNMKIHMKAMGEVVNRYGGDFDLDYAMSLNGMGNAEFFSRLFPRQVVERIGAKGLAVEKEALYRKMYAPLLAPAAGLIELLDELKSRGVKMAVGTSAPGPNLDFILDGLDIRRYFDALVTADMVTRTKPDPEIYLRALSELGLHAEQCLVFEDALAGIQAARAAGMKTVALSSSISPAVLDRTPGVALSVGDFTSLDFARLDALTYH